MLDGIHRFHVISVNRAGGQIFNAVEDLDFAIGEEIAEIRLFAVAPGFGQLLLGHAVGELVL